MTTRHPLLQRFSKLVKLTYSFPTKVAFFPTLNDDSAAHCQARKKYPFSSFFCSRIGTQLTRKRLRVTRTCYTDVKINITPEKKSNFPVSFMFKCGKKQLIISVRQPSLQKTYLFPGHYASIFWCVLTGYNIGCKLKVCTKKTS